MHGGRPRENSAPNKTTLRDGPVRIRYIYHSQAFTRNNCDRKEAEGLLERILEGNYGMPKTGMGGGAGVGAKAGAGGEGSEGKGGSADSRRADAARVLSTLSGAAFAADGVGREIAGLFTATSDGIFF